jgi:uncharacterized surface protein with fasciclin (FAS1) repeats
MFNGDFASVYFDGSNVFLNGNAQVVMPNVEAANGVIHVINNVLVP